MFNFCVVLNSAPFYVLAQNEKDLEEVLLVYKEKVAVVIKAENLEAMDFKMQMKVSSKETLMIPSMIPGSEECLSKMISESEQDEMLDDLINDVN